jgi:hypothetical protein
MTCLTYTALEMAEQQENRPSDPPKTAVRKTLKLGSGSGWTKLDLEKFQVDYRYQEYDELPKRILDYQLAPEVLASTTRW